MLILLPQPPISQLLALEDQYSAEEWLEIELLMGPLVRFQEMPDLALMATSGIVMPTHQRTMLYEAHRGTGHNVYVCSRGTAKTSTICGLYSAYLSLFFRGIRIVTLSAGGFRGGQQIFEDIERWGRGGWLDQRLPAQFFISSLEKGISRAPLQWTYKLDNFSLNTTMPTGEPDKIRGTRANVLFLDEALIAERMLIDKVIRPFLNVKGDFEHGGRLSTPNRMFFTSTVDYSHRPFMREVDAALRSRERDYAAHLALENRDFKRYEALAAEGLHGSTYVQFDYTDILIRKTLQTRDGRRFDVRWPNPKITPEMDPRGIPFSETDGQGHVMRLGRRMEYYSTYPIDKDALEKPLLEGTSDEASWLAEQRNIVDSAMGDVYPSWLVDDASCIGDRAVIPYKELPPAWQSTHSPAEGYVAPVLWNCTDPCVLGVDYAPQNDMCAFVVLRLGPLAEGEFSPLTHHGHTEWSSVIWAEQYRQMSHREAADKVLALCERYNIVYHFDAHEDDTWKMARGIGLDMRGGGSGVRDELAYINSPLLEPTQYRIYDPLDKDERIAAYRAYAGSKPMLDAIYPTDQLNEVLVEYTLGQMQQRLLFVGKYLARSERPVDQRELNIGYEAMHALAAQLRKLQQLPTKNHRTFYMEGASYLDKNKKDLWAAFIYAAKQMRAHLIRRRARERVPPPMAAQITKANSGRMYGRAKGARD